MSANAAAKSPVLIPPHKKAQLVRLTSAPRIAWPTVGLMLFIVAGIAGTDICALTGHISLRAGMLFNIAFMWPVFHVTHDALHRAASSNQRINDWIGRIGLALAAPHVVFELFRYDHMLHHRFANDPRDPDLYMSGHWLTLPFRWASFDLYYVVHNLRSADPRAKEALQKAFPQALVTVVLVALLTYAGYGWPVFMLWFIPSRVAIALIGFTFLWLPHVDRDAQGKLTHITAKDVQEGNNLTAGTTMRLGFEAILSPLMQWHNYHLIHHLWPTTPSYNHAKVWKLMEPELRARDLRIQYGLALIPVFHAAGTSSS